MKVDNKSIKCNDQDGMQVCVVGEEGGGIETITAETSLFSAHFTVGIHDVMTPFSE